MTFFDQYISTRHPNSPETLSIDAQEAALTRLEDQAALSMIEHTNALYCLNAGIIQADDFPADWRAI